MDIELRIDEDITLEACPIKLKAILDKPTLSAYEEETGKLEPKCVYSEDASEDDKVRTILEYRWECEETGYHTWQGSSCGYVEQMKLYKLPKDKTIEKFMMLSKMRLTSPNPYYKGD